jgi:hypothetical protein
MTDCICLHSNPTSIFLVKVYGLQFKMYINKTQQILYSNIAFTKNFNQNRFILESIRILTQP